MAKNYFGKAEFALAGEKIDCFFETEPLFEVIRKAFSEDIPCTFSMGPTAPEDESTPCIKINAWRGSQEPLFDQPTLPLERNRFHLQRERPITGWVLGDLMHMEDDQHFFDLHYAKQQASGFFRDSIFSTPRLLSHTYFLVTLIELLRVRDVYYLHGALVCSPQGNNILMLGQGGAGKSTTVYSLLRQGFSYVGDDALLLRSAPNHRVEVSALLRRLMLSGTLAHQFPGLLFEHIDSSGKGRVSLKSYQHPTTRQQATPHSALILDLQPEKPTLVRPLRKSQLIAELIQQNSFLFMHSELAARHLNMLTQVASQCDAGWLQLGRDSLDDPRVLKKVVLDFANRKVDTETEWRAPGVGELGFGR